MGYTRTISRYDNGCSHHPDRIRIAPLTSIGLGCFLEAVG